MEEPIDFTELSKVFPDGAVQTQVLLDFRSYIRTDHAKLIEMLEKNDANKVERAAHRVVIVALLDDAPRSDDAAGKALGFVGAP